MTVDFFALLPALETGQRYMVRCGYLADRVAHHEHIGALRRQTKDSLRDDVGDSRRSAVRSVQFLGPNTRRIYDELRKVSHLDARDDALADEFLGQVRSLLIIAACVVDDTEGGDDA